MILMLLYGLEMLLGVCGMSSKSSKLQMAGVRRIYRPPSLVAVASTVSRKSAYHRMNRCLWNTVSQCTDAPFWTIGSSGAYKLTWLRFPSAQKNHGVGSSDNHRRGGPSGLATPIFSFSLSSLEPKSMRVIILTIILVQTLCCHLIIKIIIDFWITLWLINEIKRRKKPIRYASHG